MVLQTPFLLKEVLTAHPLLAGRLVCHTSHLQRPCRGDGELQGREAARPLRPASSRAKGDQIQLILGTLCQGNLPLLQFLLPSALALVVCPRCSQPLTLLPLPQMSVLNFLVRRHPTSSEPVKAKEELIFHCGFRRFRASPLFSQHTSGL